LPGRIIVCVTDASPVPVDATAVFQLGVLGSIATARYSARIEPHALKPKHIGLMVVLDRGLASSQLDIARLMGIAPSLVVALADHLEGLGAVHRVRDPADRRRQVLTLTEHGHELLATCAAIARSLDAELGMDLAEAENSALMKLLARLSPLGRTTP
jgi:DNA-binding MarR family transcriptional regulator